MTLQGEKGSTYRGRLLYSIETMDAENPKTLTNDIKVDILSSSGPNIPVKSYRLVVALYEGIDLPELQNYKKY
jgi:hypothetical protein